MRGAYCGLRATSSRDGAAQCAPLIATYGLRAGLGFFRRVQLSYRRLQFLCAAD